MIGRTVPRRALAAIVIALAVGLGFGLRTPAVPQADPPLEAARRQGLAAAAASADAALSNLGAVLTDAIDAARRGAAWTVAGDRPPAPRLEAAADALVAGADTADAARRAVERLAGTAAAVAPDRGVPAFEFGGPDLELMAVGLHTAAAAATLFVERRRATEAVVAALGAALAALDRDLPESALERLDDATAPLALLDAWNERPPLLGYWMNVTRGLLGAARDIATATIARDPVAQAAAAKRYADAGEAARGADNALAVSLSEAGGAVTGTQLRRLAAVAGAVADERAAVQPLAAAGS